MLPSRPVYDDFACLQIIATRRQLAAPVTRSTTSLLISWSAIKLIYSVLNVATLALLASILQQATRLSSSGEVIYLQYCERRSRNQNTGLVLLMDGEAADSSQEAREYYV